MASLSSTGSVSSSNSLGNTSLRGFGGMVSGIDRDSIIEQMTLGTTTKINNVKSDITKAQWKQEAYRSLSDQILDITDKYTSFSSANSLLDPMTFAKSIITVEGSDKSSKYVKATGTSDMIDTIAIEGVEKLASSAVQQSGVKQSDKGLVTGLDDLDKDISVSKLNNGVNGRTLTIGLYSAVNGWTNTATFTFPTQYQARSIGPDGKETLLYDENGNKVMKDIDYTSKNYKDIEQQLNWALQDSSATIMVNGKNKKLSEVIQFEYQTTDSEGKEIPGKMTIKDNNGLLGNYRINTSASTALSALGYNGSSGAISVDDYNDHLGSFADSSVTKMSVLDALTNAKVNFNYNGSTKEIELITSADKAELDKINYAPGENSILNRADDVVDILAKGFGLTDAEVSTLKAAIEGVNGNTTLTDQQKEKQIKGHIQNTLSESASIKDAIQKETEDRIVAESGISRDQIEEEYIKESLTGKTDKAEAEVEYNRLLENEKNTIKAGKDEDALAEYLGINKDDVISASGLNLDDLAEIHGIKRQDIVDQYQKDHPNIDLDKTPGVLDEIKKLYEKKILEEEYGLGSEAANKKKYEEDIEAAYKTAIDEKVAEKATDALTAQAREEIAKKEGIIKNGEALGVEKPEGMSDDDYKKAVEEAYEKKIDEEIAKETSARYKTATDKVIEDARTNHTYEDVEKDVKKEILDNTYDTALGDASNDILQKKKLDKMAELLQTRLDKAFGVGKDSDGKDQSNVKAVVKDGKLTFEAASSNTSLSITTGSSGSNVLGNMGIISGASNKVNLAGNLTQESLGLSPDAFKNLEEGGDGLVINGTKIEGITKDSTISDILTKINKSDAGVKATYVQSSGQFMLVSSETGTGRQIKLNSDLALELFGQKGDDGEYIDANGNMNGFKEGQDALIHVNYGNGMSVEVSSSSNTFNLEGLNVTVTNTFGGSVNEATGKWEADPADRVTFSAKADVDAVTEKVKSFFEDFNKLITETYNQLTTRSDSDYGPLTDEQKAEMSETSIENWEKKAKEGILYNDSIIRDLNSTLEGFLTELMGSGIKYQDLESIGITYDESWSGGASTIVFNETKFRSAMENNSDLVSDIFTGTGKSGGTGLVKTVENMLTPYATRVASKNRAAGSNDRGSYGRLIEEAGSEKVPTSTLNNFIYEQIKEMNEKIQKLQSQLKTQQERYIKQFTSMETLINQYNSQSGYLSQLTG